MVKINKQFCNCNSKRKLLTDKMIYLGNKKKMNFSLISYLFLFCLLGAIFFLVKFDITQKYPNIINIAMADTINGTENADNLTGTINKDIIKGLNGNDTITGKEAGDDISGGSGDDIIYGNEGRDILRGKAGKDRIEGGEGNDRIIGDRGNDILVGGPGNDTLTGGLGKDIFICGTATDTITDFNFTQEDSIPENDCEKVKYEGNTKVSKTSSSIQQEQNPNVGNVMDINEEITPSNNNNLNN
jgi:Ca2+-binding RTX toxin-like protein